MEFYDIAHESEQEAVKMLPNYDRTTQWLFQDIINAIYHGGKMPQIPFDHKTCEIEDKIMSGYYKQTTT